MTPVVDASEAQCPVLHLLAIRGQIRINGAKADRCSAYVCVHLHLYMQVYVCACACVYAHEYMQVYVYVCVCMCMYMYNVNDSAYMCQQVCICTSSCMSMQCVVFAVHKYTNMSY